MRPCPGPASGDGAADPITRLRPPGRRRRQASRAPGRPHHPGIPIGALHLLPPPSGRRRRRGRRRFGAGTAHREPPGGDSGRHRLAPGAGAGGGVVRRRRPHRPRRGIRVTNAGAAFSADSADYAVGLVVAVLRRVPAAEAYVRRGGWAAHGDYPLATKVLLFCASISIEVSGKRVGIVGLGRIGSLVARRLAAFGCAVSYHSRSPKPSAPYRFFPTVRGLAADSDVLVLSCALTEETRHIVDREVMEALGSGGVLVNVGRGGLVDEPELVRCLRDGVIAGAGLDVYENEPHVPPELFGMDNVVLSDHRAVLTPDSIRGILDIVAGNLDAFFAGRPLLSPVAL